MIVEVMGRKAGHLALQAGIAGGADCILIPEIPYSIAGVCQKVNELRDVCDGLRLRWGRKFAIVVVAEGAQSAKNIDVKTENLPFLQCGMGQYIANQIANSNHNQLDIRVSMLGHIQRGGIPSALDRLVAKAFGKVAVDLVAQAQSDRMVAWQNGQVTAVPIKDVLAQSPLPVNPNNYLIETARSVGIYIGDV